MEEKLITAMASFPIVYDASLSGYKDTLKRSDAWKKVAEIVGSDGGFDFFFMHALTKRSLCFNIAGYVGRR